MHRSSKRLWSVSLRLQRRIARLPEPAPLRNLEGFLSGAGQLVFYGLGSQNIILVCRQVGRLDHLNDE